MGKIAGEKQTELLRTRLSTSFTGDRLLHQNAIEEQSSPAIQSFTRVGSPCGSTPGPSSRRSRAGTRATGPTCSPSYAATPRAADAISRANLKPDNTTLVFEASATEIHGPWCRRYWPFCPAIHDPATARVRVACVSKQRK